MKQKSMRLENSVLFTFPLAELLGDLLVGLALDLGEPDLGRESLPFLVKSVLGDLLPSFPFGFGDLLPLGDLGLAALFFGFSACCLSCSIFHAFNELCPTNLSVMYTESSFESVLT